MDEFRKLAKEKPFGQNGRVRLGFAMDTMFVPPKVLKTAFDEARKHGAHLITSHATQVSMMDSEFFYLSLFFLSPILPIRSAMWLLVHLTNSLFPRHALRSGRAE